MKLLLLLILSVLCFDRAIADARIFLNAKINGNPVRMIFDTGAAEPVLFRKTAERLKLQLTEPPDGHQPAIGEVKVAWTEPVDFRLSKLTLKTRFGVFDLPDGISFEADGALSWNLFRGNFFHFDMTRQVLDIGDQLPERALTWPQFKLVSESRIMGFSVTNAEPKQSCVYIDTGDPTGVQLHPLLWQKFISDQSNSNSTLLAFYSPASGLVVKKEVWARRLTIGSLTFEDIPVQEVPLSNISTNMPDFAAMLGLYALRRMNVLVDGKNGIVFAQPTEIRAPDYPHNRLGAVFVPQNLQSDALMAHVLTNTPAHLAGIREGDILLKIDDLDVTKWRTDSRIMPMSRFWERPEGTSVELVLKRGAREYKIKVALRDLLGPTDRK